MVRVRPETTPVSGGSVAPGSFRLLFTEIHILRMKIKRTLRTIRGRKHVRIWSCPVRPVLQVLFRKRDGSGLSGHVIFTIRRLAYVHYSEDDDSFLLTDIGEGHAEHSSRHA
ncbi:unnamed protein product, partial [Brenthis ino]